MHNNSKSGAALKAEGGKDDALAAATEAGRTTNRKKPDSQLNGTAKNKRQTTTVGRSSKQVKVIDVLHRKNGSSVAAFKTHTGW